MFSYPKRVFPQEFICFRTQNMFSLGIHRFSYPKRVFPWEFVGLRTTSVSFLRNLQFLFIKSFYQFVFFLIRNWVGVHLQAPSRRPLKVARLTIQSGCFLRNFLAEQSWKILKENPSEFPCLEAPPQREHHRDPFLQSSTPGRWPS